MNNLPTAFTEDITKWLNICHRELLESSDQIEVSYLNTYILQLNHLQDTANRHLEFINKKVSNEQ